MYKKKVFYINHSKLIRLVTFKKTHISKDYLSWLNDREIQYSQNRFTKHDYPSSVNYFKTQQKSKNLFLAIEVLKKTKYIHIGNVLLKIDRKNKRGHLSILIGKNNKRKGIGFLVWNKLIQIAFKKFNCEMVVAGTDSFNKPMCKIFKKAKMKCLILPNYFKHRKKRSDLIFSFIYKKKNKI